MSSSWGNYPKSIPAGEQFIDWRDQVDFSKDTHYLAYGYGRSYGDSCLNNAGILLHTRHMSRFIEFDRKSGIIRCEAGLSLQEILQTVTPYGWTLPVVPGTQFVSVGGAIANDVHGKNHQRYGTFGCHVRAFELLRSDGTQLCCSPTGHADLFSATIGGLGLTGLILWAEIQLKPIASPFVQVESYCFKNLQEFFVLNAAAEQTCEYNVAWFDCQSLGRGIYLAADFASAKQAQNKEEPKGKVRSVPFNLPDFALNSSSIKVFNRLYYQHAKWTAGKYLQHYQAYFFPLDSIRHWNRIYGRRGFLQYQCLIPTAIAQQGIDALLSAIARARQGSFLSVLKSFGNIRSPGMLSFPRPGLTLALDFPIKGEKTFALLDRLDDIVLIHGGRVYPAKDARMSAAGFQQYYPNWQEFAKFIDPKFSSSFWRRVTQGA